MTSRRTVIFVAAIVVALAAGGLSYYFLNNAQQRAFNNAKLEKAYVVTKAIPRGFSGSVAASQGYFQQKSVPAETRPATAVTDLASLTGMIAIANLPVGEVLVDGLFVSPAQAATSFSQLIPAGDVAVTATLSDPAHAVANLPQPNDKVDVMVNANGTESYIIQNVLVLAIGAQTTPTNGTTTTGTTATGTAASGTAATTTSLIYTFATSPANALRIAEAQQAGLGLYLALVPANNPVVNVPGVNPGNILSTGTPS